VCLRCETHARISALDGRLPFLDIASRAFQLVECAQVVSVVSAVEESIAFIGEKSLNDYRR
jgi:hypothetical protein